MTDVELRVEHGRLPAFLAAPESPGPWPGVVVIHEALGLTEDIRSIADRLARSGYLALAPDFLAWGRRFSCLRSAFAQLRAGHGRTFDELDEARRWLGGQPGCSGRVGVIGFCLGGGFALLSAGSGFDVAAVNYGLVPADAERALAGACPWWPRWVPTTGVCAAVTSGCSPRWSRWGSSTTCGPTRAPATAS
ncbi:MAG TPA: dienelactone hydrolase family protein [Actinomycetes bacterium]